jgi:putative intracellular protease/amidase
MLQSAEYRQPIAWADAGLDDVDALLLPGGHRARGMRSYIDSAALQALVSEAFRRGKLVAAICHGVLLAARSVGQTGRSVLYGRKTTALTWDFERRAWKLTRVTRFWDPDYYRTYSERPGDPAGYMSVQAEVTRALENPDDFRDVAKDSPHRRAQTSGMARDTATDSRPAFVVDDSTYISARWPGDTHTFAAAVSARLHEKL